jgi:hypothetical protein
MPCQKVGEVGGEGDFERSVNGLVGGLSVENGAMMVFVGLM